MDAINTFLITIILIFLPGICSTIVCEKLIIHERWNAFKFAIYSFVLGILSYALLQVIYYIYQIPLNNHDSSYEWKILETWKSISSESPSIQIDELLLALPASIAVAFLISLSSTKNWIYEIAKSIGVSNKYGDENLFYFYLNSRELYWVYIRDIENNLTYLGRIMYFSLKDGFQELVLADVSVYEYNSSQHLYDIESIYLSKKMGQFIIEQAKK